MEVTSVTATGEAEAPFNLVGFSVLLSEVASSVPLAKAKLKNKIADLDTALSALLTRLGIEMVKDSLHSSSQAAEKHEYVKNEYVSLGQEVSYSLSFQISDMDRVNEVYDALTSLDYIKVGQPIYSIKNREGLNKKALKNAFKKVQDRFEMECNIFKLDPNSFDIATWEVTYSDTRRTTKHVERAVRGAAGGAAPSAAPAAVAMSADLVEGSALGGSRGTINLVSGLAKVTVNLEVSYKLKNNLVEGE